jgi:hypothetical protein
MPEARTPTRKADWFWGKIVDSEQPPYPTKKNP